MTQRLFSKESESMIKHLAADFHVPETHVKAVFQSEVRQLQQDARVKNFIMILAARRVKELIKAGPPSF